MDNKSFDLSPGQKLLYKYIISQLHFDGLEAIAMILSNSLQNLRHITPSNDLSQLVNLCVHWNKLPNIAGLPPTYPSVSLGTRGTNPLLNPLNLLDKEAADVILQESLLSMMKNDIMNKLNRTPEVVLSPTKMVISDILTPLTQKDKNNQPQAENIKHDLNIKRMFGDVSDNHISSTQCTESVDDKISKNDYTVVELSEENSGGGISRAKKTSSSSSSCEAMSDTGGISGGYSSMSSDSPQNSFLNGGGGVETTAPPLPSVTLLSSESSAIPDTIPTTPPVATNTATTTATAATLGVASAATPECGGLYDKDTPNNGGRERTDDGGGGTESYFTAVSPLRLGENDVTVKLDNAISPTLPTILSANLSPQIEGTLPSLSSNEWKCPKCFMVVSNMADLALHIKHCLDSPGDNYCRECGRGYSSKASLQRHISVVHRKERNYECHICRKRFGQQIHVDVHMRLHTGEKPFVCHVCNDSFKQSAHLKRHMQSHVRCPAPFSSPSHKDIFKKYDSVPYKRPMTADPHFQKHVPYTVASPFLSRTPLGLPASLRHRYPILSTSRLLSPPVSAPIPNIRMSPAALAGRGVGPLGEVPSNNYTLELMKLISQTKNLGGTVEASR